MNEKGKIIVEARDGNEVCAIADSITLTSGLYSVQSLYAVINFKGIVPVYSPVL
jgi:hypothetical protein